MHRRQPSTSRLKRKVRPQMIDSNFQIAEENFFRLPLKDATRALTIDTLNRHSDFRRPKKPYLRIKQRKISFHNELLTIGVTLDDEDEERIYIKVTTSELLVSCSVDTTNGYLSRYAYFALYDMMSIYDEVDFEDYYWPGFFDEKGQSKYLRINFYKGSLTIQPKLRYKGIYKPGQLLPLISANVKKNRKLTDVVLPERPQTDMQDIIGFCLADTSLEKWHSNHFPFLVPYTGILNKGMNSVKGFKKYILDGGDLPDIEIDRVQRELIAICFEMKKIALVKYREFGDDELEGGEKRKANKHNFGRLLELWHEALPLLSGSRYTHYRFTYGMRNVKGKPFKQDMKPCVFGNEVPEICFLWKDKRDYFKLEVRFLLKGNMYEVSSFFYTAFFICASGHPKKYYFLQTVTECDLMALFNKRNFQLLMLKPQYELYCQDFISNLRKMFNFYHR